MVFLKNLDEKPVQLHEFPTVSAAKTYFLSYASVRQHRMKDEDEIVVSVYWDQESVEADKPFKQWRFNKQVGYQWH